MPIQVHPLDNNTLDSLDMSSIQNSAFGDSNSYISSKSGKEHYRLLTYISQINNNKKIIDLGTFKGWSALSLAHNLSNTVISYDIADCFTKSEQHLRPNLTYKIKNFLDDLGELNNTDLILLDIDPHDGIQEKILIEKLIELNYKGAVIMDDINHFTNLADYYRNLPFKKDDLTAFGHSTGTGIIYFDN
jgi:predicted O-methyltransferase YrrM